MHCITLVANLSLHIFLTVIHIVIVIVIEISLDKGVTLLIYWTCQGSEPSLLKYSMKVSRTAVAVVGGCLCIVGLISPNPSLMSALQAPSTSSPHVPRASANPAGQNLVLGCCRSYL